MPLTQQQIQELDIASARIAAGTGSETDQANVDYATQTFGYSYTPTTPTPTSPPPLPPTSPSQEPIVGQGIYIPNEAALQQRREELAAAGIAESEFGDFISAPTADDPRLFFRQPATLTSPTGEVRRVATGSQEANNLFSQGWTLGGTFDDNIISSDTMSFEQPIDIGDDQLQTTFEADTVAGGFDSTISSTQTEIDRLQQLLIGEIPETESSATLNALIASLDPDSLTGRGVAQLNQEEMRGVERLRQSLLSKQAELKQKSNEINALTASYNLANKEEETKHSTLSRLRGAQGRNYERYLLQKNALTADAAFIQSDLLAMQGQLSAAQNAADRAVDLRYQDRLDRYNSTIRKINILAPQVEAEEKRYLAQIQLDLQNQQGLLGEQKNTQKQVLGLKIEYVNAMLSAGKTPDVAVLSQFSEVKSLDDAINLLAQNSPIEGATSINVVTDVGGQSYDIGTYATDPNHEARIKSILSNMGQMTSVEQMDQYIQSKASGSPVTGEMISKAAEQHGVSWEIMMAIMEQDSSFGTAGKGARTFNPGNVGNTDTGAEVNFGNWQAGVDAVAENLSRRKTTTPSITDTGDPMSTNETTQFKNLYDWTPPAGMSKEMATTIMNSNPNATSEELEAAANEVQNHFNTGGTLENLPDEIDVSGTGGGQPSSDRLTAQGLRDRIQQARSGNASNQQIKDAILNAYSIEDLKEVADSLGYSSFWSGKRTDVNRMLNALVGE